VYPLLVLLWFLLFFGPARGGSSIFYTPSVSFRMWPSPNPPFLFLFNICSFSRLSPFRRCPACATRSLSVMHDFRVPPPSSFLVRRGEDLPGKVRAPLFFTSRSDPHDPRGEFIFHLSIPFPQMFLRKREFCNLSTFPHLSLFPLSFYGPASVLLFSLFFVALQWRVFSFFRPVDASGS